MAEPVVSNGMTEVSEGVTLVSAITADVLVTTAELSPMARQPGISPLALSFNTHKLVSGSPNEEVVPAKTYPPSEVAPTEFDPSRSVPP